MYGRDKFERAVSSLYEAALHDAERATAAGWINEAIRARGHSIAYGDSTPKGTADVFSSRFYFGAQRRTDWERMYLEDYLWQDDVVARFGGLRDGQLVSHVDLYTERERRTSPVYTEFMRVVQGQNGVSVPHREPDGCSIVWAIADSVEPGGWTATQIETIQRLSPHVRQCVRVRRALADAQALGASLAGLLGNTRMGIIQLDRRGRIAEANDRARELLSKDGRIHDRQGVLAATTPESNARLERLLARAAPRYGAQGVGGSMTIGRPRAGAAEPLVVHVHPVCDSAHEDRPGRVATLVLIADPTCRPRIDPQLAQVALGLSPAESRVAVGLAAGRSAAEIAAEVGCAESTVRWHMKRIYLKHGITKQTELVRRILLLEVFGAEGL